MAIIQKIRNKYAKVAGFVIALALVGFILMDAASGSFGDLFGRDNSVVKVNGEKIDVKDYSQRVKDYEILYAYSTKGRALDDATRAQLNDEALRDLINEKLMNEVADKLGLHSSKEEEKDLIYGPNPDPAIQQYPVFTNPDTKMFDPQRVKMFEEQVDKQDPTGKFRDEWETLKAYVLRTNIQKKYNALLVRNLYVPAYLADYKLKEQKENASVRFVKISYSSIPDKDVPVTEEEMNEYVKKHAAQYTNKQETRSIEYVSFDVVPVAEDTTRALGALNDIKNEFSTTTDIESIVNRNSDEPYNDAFVNKQSMMSYYADSILKMPVGSVFGPYYEAGVYKLTKVLDKKLMADSVKCRHILIRTKEKGNDVAADSVAKRRIDSVQVALNSGANFDTMVQKVSEDEGSKGTNGEYTFTLQQKAGISKEFGDFIFDGKPGEKKVVKVDNAQYAGYHYIEILEQKRMQSSAKLATISKALFAGDNTENAMYAKATEFAGKNNNAKAFDEAVKTAKVDKKLGDNVKVSDFAVPGLGSAREVVRWMYDAKEGDVSGVFQMEGRYVVAKLTAINEPGLMKITDNIRPQIETSVRFKKKAAIINEKYKSSTNIDAIATASGQTAATSDSFNAANSFSQKIGYEPKAIGYCFNPNFKAGTLSPGLAGQDGVVFVSLVERFTKEIDPMMAQQQKMMQENQLRNSAGGLIMDIVREKAKIKFNAKNL